MSIREISASHDVPQFGDMFCSVRQTSRRRGGASSDVRQSIRDTGEEEPVGEDMTETASPSAGAHDACRAIRVSEGHGGVDVLHRVPSIRERKL